MRKVVSREELLPGAGNKMQIMILTNGEEVSKNITNFKL
jgi:hypothetical protein